MKRFIKIVYYKLVKTTINVTKVLKIIINMVIRHHSLPHSIMSHRMVLFTSKFWLSLCYLLSVKKGFLLLFMLKQIVKLKNKII